MSHLSEKIKYELEFPIQASPNMLYQYISTASSLSEWFADNVNSRGKIFSFFWDGVEEKAELMSYKNNKYVRFKWLENDDETFFEIDTWLGKKNKLKTITKEDFYIIINKKDIRNLTVTLNYSGPIKAPIKENEKVAELIIKKKDELIKTLPLYASEDLKKVNFFQSLITSLNYLIWGDV